MQAQRVTVRFYGGIGNQLFQFFAAHSVAKRFKVKPEFDFYWLDKKGFHDKSDIRDFLFFNQYPNILKSTKSITKYFVLNFLTSIALRSPALAKIFKIDVSNGFTDISPSTWPGGLRLHGYYQTTKFFDEFISEIEFPNFNQLSLNDSSILYTSPKNFIAIHIRGGDYLVNENIYCTLSSEYYISALNLFKVQFPDSQIVVFTNDKEHASKLLNGIHEYSYFNDSNLRASEVLVEMSKARALIIANSTFSYWAGLTSSSEVICPKKWYADGKSGPNYPDHWKQIDN